MEAIRPRLRALRAALFAALCLTLSSTSHVLMAKAPLPLPAVAVAFAAVFALVYLATARPECGFWTLAGLMVPLELAVDTVLTTGQQACYGAFGGPVTGPWRSFNEAFLCHTGHVGPTPATPLAAVPGGAQAAAQMQSSALPWLLLAVHVCVGLLAAWWLRRGEAALHQTVRAVALAAFRPLLFAAAAIRSVLTAVPHRVRPAARTRGAGGPTARRLHHAVVRRGPPVPATA
ncbi:hypothetical protein [Actinacidiphila paucisporea]|uniref:Integral membrane protein n=1 Tax=Actinacidiphila paucisporea TaxID=310782 RepID=A0A1M7DVB9_9ACTN|nr:hypothetical protein [Actinacidiphila paucisporea]SHL83445.1 hypothetical protein SAMN05216499_106196 [Actinacidiphila paucisporea]